MLCRFQHLAFVNTSMLVMTTVGDRIRTDNYIFDADATRVTENSILLVDNSYQAF